MEAWLRSWWQQIKKHRVAIGVVAIVLVVAITLIIVGYWFDWAGFSGYNKIIVAHTISGTNAGTVIRTEEYQPGKTLWDWLQLLIIPVVLAVGGYVINLTISRGEQEATRQRAQSEREAADKRAETERKIASDNQREAALQAYINEMSELLLHENLRESSPEDEEVRKIARVRTLTVLRRLDAERKGSVLEFLHESGLIDKDKRIIDLTLADLSHADLSHVDLSAANLINVDLSHTDMRNADLSYANLSYAFLTNANLTGANLTSAYLVGADLIKANLEIANLSYAWLVDANLIGANLIGANLTGANLTGANLRMTNLTKADLSDANPTKADLSDANLTKAKISQYQLDQVISFGDTKWHDGSIHP